MRPRAFQLVDAGARTARDDRRRQPRRARTRCSATRCARRAASTSAARSPRARGRAAVDTGDDIPIDPRLIDSAAERGDDVLLTRFDAAALIPVVNGTQPLYVEVDRASDILAVLALRDEFPALRLVLVGATEGWLVAREIAAAGVPVIAEPLTDLPAQLRAARPRPSRNVGRMVDAGVKVAIGGFAGDNQPRYAPQQAGNLVALTRLPGRDAG